LLGEILLEQGRRGDAEAPLMTLVEDYNADRIRKDDAKSLALVGRAAYLLRSPRDANDAFNEAERARKGDVQTLLYRAELFLEKYDPGHAEEVTREVLQQAPEQPQANVWMAHVKLAQALDFDEAERLAKKALAVDGKLASAYFVLAGIALRDMELAQADRHCDAGLAHNPRDLDLLSMKAAVRFLAEDAAGFTAAKARVLKLNPEYARLYQIVGDYADWEHRYDEIVAMMREALRIDAEDAKAYAQLGLNLVRAGDESAGVSALRDAFDRDPYNVRVYNTLNLFEKVIPQHYVTVPGKLFTLRYHREEKPILERYVPQLLETAWRKMVKLYGFTPSTPVGIELYAERENFSIRTSGLPHTAIQGVCFGKTLAAMSPKQESFNVGMTLWHELAHVFHIQLSKNRVPRWFTEGLAEYETLAERAEWAREQDPDLYEALRSSKLPEVASMNRAFTRAEQMSDVATAYYASSQILRMLVERHGMTKMSRMLALWGEGKSTPAVLQEALGATPAQIDQEFRKDSAQRLSRYSSQFVPMGRVGSLEQAKQAAEGAPADAKKQAAYAFALLREGQLQAAEARLALALKADGKLPDALFLNARILLGKKRADDAARALASMAGSGQNGFAVQMLLADVWQAKGDMARMQSALTEAARLDPTQSEPLLALADLAKKQNQPEQELVALRKLAALEQHEPVVYRRLLRALNARRGYEEAVRVGEAALYADLEGWETHALFAEALAASKMLPRAIYELETAVLCPARPGEKAAVHAQLAQTYLLVPNRAAAVKHAKIARELDKDHPRVKQLKL
jgi:tetratricopeptide (TPR) repeat protein